MTFGPVPCMACAMQKEFTKMNGLGNDFVVLDGRQEPVALSADVVQRIADRRLGVGCDQLIVIEPSREADAFMRIYNADGSEVGACGNATRCVGALLGYQLARTAIFLETEAGILNCVIAEDGRVRVDMGAAGLRWQDIPLAEECDTLNLGIAFGELSDPVGVSMGNPHAVFFVPDVDAVLLEAVGPELEHHPLFPERANIGVAAVESPTRIRLRVWERGAGETKACGTGACAALVAAARRGLTERQATIQLPGGELFIEWDEKDHVFMTGDVATSFTGILDDSLLEGRS